MQWVEKGRYSMASSPGSYTGYEIKIHWFSQKVSLYFITNGVKIFIAYESTHALNVEEAVTQLKEYAVEHLDSLTSRLLTLKDIKER